MKQQRLSYYIRGDISRNREVVNKPYYKVPIVHEKRYIFCRYVATAPLKRRKPPISALDLGRHFPKLLPHRLPHNTPTQLRRRIRSHRQAPRNLIPIPPTHHKIP